MREDAPVDFGDGRSEAFDEGARLGLAARRGSNGGGIMPDDIVVQHGEHGFGVLAGPGGDQLLELVETGVAHAACSTMKLTVVVVDPPILSVCTRRAPST